MRIQRILVASKQRKPSSPRNHRLNTRPRIRTPNLIRNDEDGSIIQQKPSAVDHAESDAAPSLFDQLFPEHSSKGPDSQQPRKNRVIPRLPIDLPLSENSETAQAGVERLAKLNFMADMRRRMDDGSGPYSNVLILRHASPNLLIDDFRRLIPQGKYIEGWTFVEGDIVKVVPARHSRTLAHLGVYYLLFSTPLSAFIYHDHLKRIHQLAGDNTRDKTRASIPPSPQISWRGLNVLHALQAYTLFPPDQELQIKHIHAPLPPYLDEIARYGGAAALMDRPNKSPFEVRFTLDGANIRLPVVTRSIRRSGTERGLSWSGGDATVPRISLWKPENPAYPFPWQRDWDDPNSAYSTADGEAMAEEPDKAKKPRAEPPVYIIGFEEEATAQSFAYYWHRRKLDLDESSEHHKDPPTVNVELLW